MKALAHLEARRIRAMDGDAYNGAFRLIAAPTRATLYAIASDGGGWDHVSITVAGERRCPMWIEMVWVKDQFFESGETVMQLHPSREYVNNHPHCLHLWRPQAGSIPLPPSLMVGFTELTPRDVARMTRAGLEALRALAATGSGSIPRTSTEANHDRV